MLPTALLINIGGYLPTAQLGTVRRRSASIVCRAGPATDLPTDLHTHAPHTSTQVSAVCKGWNELLGGDAIWKPLYIKRFHFLDPREAVGVRAFKRLFRERLLDPHVRERVDA